MSEVQTESKTSAIMNTYNRFPLALVRGKGSYVWDKEGRKYLDYTSGIATCNLGHVPENVKQKLSDQIDSLWHCSNLYEIPHQERLAQILKENSSLDRVFFCNSGAEANEAAIKIAKKYANDQGKKGRTEIVTFKQSFHGRTGVTMAATGQEKIHQGFTPLSPGFRYLAFNDFEALTQIDNGKTTAVLLELVQGEGGVHPANQEWIKQLETICKENDILLMIDEVQTGIGRTGTLFAYEQFDIEPDVITLAKGLGSGFPIGAMLATDKVAKAFQPGTHGSTFGGNPLAMAAGIATIETILQEDLLSNVQYHAKFIREELTTLKTNFSFIQHIRGLGFLIGVELAEEVGPWIKELRDKGILVLAAGANVLRVLPPLTTSSAELESFIHAFQQVLSEKEERKV